MNRPLKCLLALLAVISAAAPASARRAELDALPRWSTSEKSPKKPAAIAAKARAPGLYAFRLSGSSVLSTLLPSTQTDEARMWEELTNKTVVPATCLIYENKAQTGATANSSMQSFPQTGIYALRAELLRHTGKKTAELDITRVWFDSHTLGATVYEQKSEPLVEIGNGPGGIHIYAGRNGEVVNFVVETPPLPKEILDSPGRDATLAQLNPQLAAQVQAGDPEAAFSSTCRHVTVTADAGAKDGNSTNVSLAVITPPRGAKTRNVGDLLFRRVNIDLSVSRVQSERNPVIAAGMGFQGRAARLSEIVVPAPELEQQRLGAFESD